jgi:hypothetical protein
MNLKPAQRFIRQVFCTHLWKNSLVFEEPPLTHTLIRSCLKCGKGSATFKGTRTQYREYYTKDNK